MKIGKFRDLVAKMSPESQEEIRKGTQELLQEMALSELRMARQLTQTQLAEVLKVPQSSISKIEQRADIYLSTLRSYIEATGGELKLMAKYPDREIPIRRIGDLAGPAQKTSGRVRSSARKTNRYGGNILPSAPVAAAKKRA